MGPLEDAARLVEVVTGVKQHHDPQPVAAPLLDFVEVAAISVVRVVGLFVSPIAHGLHSTCADAIPGPNVGAVGIDLTGRFPVGRRRGR